ncbi:MAG TPA: cadherin-like beta sandwich domain-containing protein [Sediminispirochaeta sp.]|nr:cadherin-like beta sandwich domain-containing protein [Sediminispirochaeta sp.]
MTGIISGTSISATVPYGTDVTSLVATFETTGDSVSVDGNVQSSGESANDFTSPVVYTVTAEDGGSSEYTVTVSITGPPVEESSAFASANTIGDQAIVTLNVAGSSQDFVMVYANNHSTITFPTGLDDSGSATLSTQFWMGETEVVNSVVAEVLQWACDNGKFCTNSADPNYLGTDYL